MTIIEWDDANVARLASVIKTNPGISNNELADRFGTSFSSIRTILYKLRRRGIDLRPELLSQASEILSRPEVHERFRELWFAVPFVPVPEMVKEFGVSYNAIVARAAKNGWPNRKDKKQFPRAVEETKPVALTPEQSQAELRRMAACGWRMAA